MPQTVKKLPRKRKYKGLFFVLPWIIGFTIFGIIPLVYSLAMSFTDWGLTGPETGYIGLENYLTALQSSNFWNSLLVTIKYAIFAIPLTIIAGFTSALLLNSNIKGISFYRGVYYLPVICSGVAIAIMWGWILSPDGLLNQFLANFGIEPIGWFTDPNLVIPSYVIMATWGAFSGFLTYLVAMKQIPQSLYQSAKLNGVNYFERLWIITIPLMRPILIYNLIIAIIMSFRKFCEAYILGGAGEQGKFYMVYFYEEAFTYYNMGYAVALAWILIIIIFTLVLCVYKFTPFWDYYTTTKKRKGNNYNA